MRCSLKTLWGVAVLLHFKKKGEEEEEGDPQSRLVIGGATEGGRGDFAAPPMWHLGAFVPRYARLLICVSSLTFLLN